MSSKLQNKDYTDRMSMFKANEAITLHSLHMRDATRATIDKARKLSAAQNTQQFHEEMKKGVLQGAKLTKNIQLALRERTGISKIERRLLNIIQKRIQQAMGVLDNKTFIGDEKTREKPIFALALIFAYSKIASRLITNLKK